jgi:hypothetical protein
MGERRRIGRHRGVERRCRKNKGSERGSVAPPCFISAARCVPFFSFLFLSARSYTADPSSWPCPETSKRRRACPLFLPINLYILYILPTQPPSHFLTPPLPNHPYSFTMDAFTAIFTPFVASAAEPTDAPVADSRSSAWSRNYSAFTCVIA